MIRRWLIATCAAVMMLVGVGTVLTVAQGGSPQVPDHFHITEYADLSSSAYGSYRNPTALAVGPDGRVYVALLSGRIYAFEDTDGDDRQDTYQLFGREPAFPAGMAWRGQALYVAFPGQVRVLEDLDSDGDAFDDPESESFIGGLPETVEGVAFDPDGYLYVSAYADCDACEPDDVRQGAVLRFNPDGSGEMLYARGLHAPHDLSFYPGTDDLFAPDDGRDDLGADEPPDEWNFIQQGRTYGWPHCWEGGSDPGYEVFCTWSADPLVTFPAHSSPAGLAFHDGTAMPAAYANNGFVALRDLGEVYRVVVTPDGMGGYTATASPFATGFEEPVDVAVGPDGAIYVADYAARKVYCIRALPDLSGSDKRVEPFTPEPGDWLTYTLNVVAVGQGSPFTLTDPFPLSTTYVADSAWALGGTITQVGGLIRWWGVVSPNTTLTATFVVQVDGAIPTPAAILNTAVLTGEEDVDSPYTLRALAFVDPVRCYLPVTARNH